MFGPPGVMGPILVMTPVARPTRASGLAWVYGWMVRLRREVRGEIVADQKCITCKQGNCSGDECDFSHGLEFEKEAM